MKYAEAIGVREPELKAGCSTDVTLVNDLFCALVATGAKQYERPSQPVIVKTQ